MTYDSCDPYYQEDFYMVTTAPAAGAPAMPTEESYNAWLARGKALSDSHSKSYGNPQAAVGTEAHGHRSLDGWTG